MHHLLKQAFARRIHIPSSSSWWKHHFFLQIGHSTYNMCVTKKSYFFQMEYLECVMIWKLYIYPCGNSVSIAAVLLSVIYMEVFLWVRHPLSPEWTGYAKSKRLLKWNQFIFSLWHHRSHLPWSWNKIPGKVTYREKSVFWLIVYGYK